MAVSPAADIPRKDTKPKGFPPRFLELSSIDGETMGTTASPLLNPIAAELDGASPGLTADALARRVKQRRHTLGVQVVSYALGAGVLLIYAYAGTITMLIPSAFFLMRRHPDRGLRAVVRNQFQRPL